MYTIDNLPASIQLQESKKCNCGQHNIYEINVNYKFHFQIEDTFNETYYRTRKYKMWYKWDDFHAICDTIDGCIIEMVDYLKSIGQEIYSEA